MNVRKRSYRKSNTPKFFPTKCSKTLLKTRTLARWLKWKRSLIRVNSASINTRERNSNMEVCRSFQASLTTLTVWELPLLLRKGQLRRILWGCHMTFLWLASHLWVVRPQFQLEHLRHQSISLRSGWTFHQSRDQMSRWVLCSRTTTRSQTQSQAMRALQFENKFCWSTTASQVWIRDTCN